MQTRKPVSEKQLAANRANAKKSTGPTTQEGKSKSRFNSLKHGLSAVQVCLPGESEAEYEQRRQEYVDHFKPANIVELDILNDLVASRWRKERLIRFENINVLDVFSSRRLEVKEDFHSISLDAETALAFRELCDRGPFLKIIDRYEGRLLRNISAAWKQLHEAIANRPPACNDGPAEPATPEPQNEPICPTPEPRQAPQPVHEPIGQATKPMTIIRKSPLPPPPTITFVPKTATATEQCLN